MSYKHWPYWVRGGGGGLIFSLFVISLSVIFFALCYNDEPRLVPSYCQSISFFNVLGNTFFFLGEFVYNILFYIFVGTLVGYLYGKFKNRNSLVINKKSE